MFSSAIKLCSSQPAKGPSLTDGKYKKSLTPVKGECPGMSVFFKEFNEVFHTCSTYAKCLDWLLLTYGLLDPTPPGKQDTKMDYWKFHGTYTEEDLKSSQ